jgi:hypothetical protein
VLEQDADSSVAAQATASVAARHQDRRNTLVSPIFSYRTIEGKDPSLRSG